MLVRTEYRFDLFSHAEVCGTKDAGTQSGFSVESGTAHRHNALNKLGFAHALHFLGSVGAIERTTLCENSLNDVVPAIVKISHDFFAQINFLFEAGMRFHGGAA